MHFQLRSFVENSAKQVPIWMLRKCKSSQWYFDITCFLAATRQLCNGLFRPSVHPPVCLSVRHTYFTVFPSSYHPIIVRSYYQWPKWGPCKRWRSEVKVKVTEVMTPLSHFWTITPVWIYIWRSNDAQSLMLPRRGALLFFKLICQISRFHG